MWRGPHCSSGDLDSQPDAPCKERARGTNTPAPPPFFQSLWCPLVVQQEARDQGSLLMSSMLVSLLDTGLIGESWKGDLEVQMEITLHRI